MKAIRQFALILAVLLPLVAPAMACAVPGANLTTAERACCEQMASQCSHMKMPASHGCCDKEPPITAQWNVAQLPSRYSQATLNPIADLAVSAPLLIPSGIRGDIPQHRHALPQSPPAAISVLRI